MKNVKNMHDRAQIPDQKIRGLGVFGFIINYTVIMENKNQTVRFDTKMEQLLQEDF